MSVVHAILVAACDTLEAEPELACRVRTALGRADHDRWIGERDFANGGEYEGHSWRSVTDAARAQEIKIGRIGRTPVVRQSVLDAWIESRGGRQQTDAERAYEELTQ